MAKVSIIVNCYNGEKYLRQALQSIREQTFQDYEVIFIDNCSTDQSASIAKSFGTKLKYYKTDKTIPLGAGRNYALDRCAGEYVAFLDCDDLWEPDKLTLQTRLLDANPTCCVTMSNISMLNMMDGKKSIVLKDTEEKKVSFEDFAIDYEYGMSSFMLRNSAVKAMDFRFDNRLSYAEEYDFFLRLACFGEVIYLPGVLAVYRVHTSMNSKKLKDTIPGEYNIVLHNLKTCREGICEEYPKVFLYLEFLRDYTQTKIFLEQKENKKARAAIKPYITRYKKALAFYGLSFLPQRLSHRLFTSYYSHRVV